MASDADPAVEVVALRERLHEVEEALRAVRAGWIDALVVGDRGDERVVTFSSADLPFRVMVQNLGEGAATVSRQGVFLFANKQIGQLLGVEVDAIIGTDLVSHVVDEDRHLLDSLLLVEEEETRRAELALITAGGTATVLLAVTALVVEGLPVVCCVVTDVTAQRVLEGRLTEEMRRAEQRSDRLGMARDVNDTIVQGLVAAEMAFDLDDLARARHLIASVSAQARGLIGELVGGNLTPGMAVRGRPVSGSEGGP